MKFRHRFLIILFLVSITGAIVVAAGVTALVRSVVRERFVERIRSETALLADWVEATPAGSEQALAVRVAESMGVRVTFIAPDGRVTADSAKSPAALLAMDNHLGRPEVQAAARQRIGESFRVSSTTREEYFYSARRVGTFGFVRIALPSRQVYQVQSRYAGLIVGMLLLSVIVMTGVSYLVVRRLSRPVEWMTEAVERAAEGDLISEIPRSGAEEVLRLDSAVRKMQAELLRRISELASERNVLSSVISGIREGLLLLGPDQRVQLANKAFLGIFESGFDPTGHLLAEVVRDPTVIADIENAYTKGVQSDESVLRLPGSTRSFAVRVTPLFERDETTLRGALVLLFDISRLETLERVRREFVANVSHELRTPLTSIRASVENLLDMDLNDRKSAETFLDIVQRNTDHMGTLIDDLTDLSLIETGSIQLDITEVDATEVAREVSERLRPLAADRGVRIHVESESPFSVLADRRRLEQMLTNLLDNAVKYNREGGRVTVLGRNGNGLRELVVEDTGIGIPAESRDKVFHRFFRVSRDAYEQRRSTGLGLAIVKHLMLLHGGRVRVESELGHGSRFILEFRDAESLRTDRIP